MDNQTQFLILQVGVLVGQDDPALDINSFGNLEDLRILLNLKYDINIEVGMEWPDVITTLKKGIDAKRYNEAMDTL